MGYLASQAQCAIRASKAVRARRDYGLPYGDRAAFWAWLAWQRGVGPVRRELEPLGVAEAILWAAMMDWGLDPCEP